MCNLINSAQMQLRIHHYGWALVCLFLFACSKKDGPGGQDPDPDPSTPGTPTVTQAGVPDGTPAVQKVIGTAGGSLKSHDGGMTVTVPAGAFTGNQTVKIQRISSTNPLAGGQGYRIEPHGIKFAKPVTLTIQAGDSLLTGTFKGALGIAYRNDKGIWMAMPKAVVNETAKTVSVQTTHFSDWEFFKGVRLKASATQLDMLQASNLRVEGNLKVFNDPLESEEPLSNALIDPKLIKSWTLAQKYGTLIPKGAEAVYGAPGYLASTPWNPNAVTVELNGPGNAKYLLVQGIQVVAGYFEFQIGGGPVKTFSASPLIRVGSRWTAVDHEEEATGIRISMGIKGNLVPGSYPWTFPTDDTGTYLYITIGNETWHAIYDDPATQAVEIIPSPGEIKITGVNDKTGYVRGTFSATRAGTASSDFKNQVRMTGYFYIQKLPE